MIVEIPVGQSIYKISCQEGEEEKLLEVAQILNKRVNKLSRQLKSADEKTLLVIAALMAEEELQRAKKDEDSEEAKLDEQDMFEAISETMENVCDYVDKLAKKIQNY